MARVKESATSPAIAASVEDFLLSARARRLSPQTVSFYATTCKKVLLPFCQRSGVEDVAELKQSHLERLAVELQDTAGAKGPRSPFTVKAYLKGINQFLSWARKRGIETPKAEMPKTPKRDIDVLSRGEVQDLEDAAEIERDKLVIRVLADTGARLDEVTRLRAEDVFERDRRMYIRVRGKGDKDRVIPVFPRVFARLRRHVERNRAARNGADRLFMSRRRRPGDEYYEPLTTSGVYLIVKRAAARAGVGKRVYPHLLRHSAITWMLSRGMSPVSVANVAGHGSLDTIYRVYSHLTPMNIADEMTRLLVDETDR
jgi:integrase/recombinase XerD